MDEFKTFIMNSIKEEDEDRQKYKAWAEKARGMGMHKAAHYLREMAHEELTHKEALERILHMM
jgi:rubrerythrin